VGEKMIVEVQIEP